MNVSYHVRWWTRNSVRESVQHEGHMIGILPGRTSYVAPDGSVVDYGQPDRAVIVEVDPPGEIPGTRFKVVDLSDLTVLGPWDDTR